MAETSLWTFIVNAGVVVKCVMLILLFASISSWTIIFQRSKQVRDVKNASKDFEAEFWAGVDMQNFYEKMNYSDGSREGLSSIFHEGFKAFQRLSSQTASNTTILKGTERAMQIAHQQEIEALEKNLGFLATVGSSSPFIGLFGTVWGIMLVLQTLGSAQQASIAMVAPGISEALIATAIGLFAAIPAVIGYNRLITSVDAIDSQFLIFREELSGIFQNKLLEANNAK